MEFLSSARSCRSDSLNEIDNLWMNIELIQPQEVDFMVVGSSLDSFSSSDSNSDNSISQIYSDVDFMCTNGIISAPEGPIETFGNNNSLFRNHLSSNNNNNNNNHFNLPSSRSFSFLERDPDDGYLVLVVDDSIVSRKITQSKLSGTFLGHCWKVFSAENGEVALDEVLYTAGVSSQKSSNGTGAVQGKRIPDVIIIDQQMHSTGGRMLGHEVVTCIRSHSAFENVIIIGCTSFGDNASGLMFASGCDAVWNKPMPSQSEAMTQILELMSFRGTYHHDGAFNGIGGTAKGGGGIGGLSFLIPSEKEIATIGYSQQNNKVVKTQRFKTQKKILTRQADGEDGDEDSETRNFLSTANMAAAVCHFYGSSDPNNGDHDDDDMDEVCSVVSSITAGTFASSSFLGELQHDHPSMNYMH